MCGGGGGRGGKGEGMSEENRKLSELKVELIVYSCIFP